jgi:hypothetical protein
MPVFVLSSAPPSSYALRVDDYLGRVDLDRLPCKQLTKGPSAVKGDWVRTNHENPFRGGLVPRVAVWSKPVVLLAEIPTNNRRVDLPQSFCWSICLGCGACCQKGNLNALALCVVFYVASFRGILDQVSLFCGL